MSLFYSTAKLTIPNLITSPPGSAQFFIAMHEKKQDSLVGEITCEMILDVVFACKHTSGDFAHQATP